MCWISTIWRKMCWISLFLVVSRTLNVISLASLCQSSVSVSYSYFFTTRACTSFSLISSRKSIFRRRSPDTMLRRNSINSNSLRRNCVLMYPRLTFAWFSLRLLIRRNRPRRQLRRGALRAPPPRAPTRKLLYILALHIPPTPTL